MARGRKRDGKSKRPYKCAWEHATCLREQQDIARRESMSDERECTDSCDKYHERSHAWQLFAINKVCKEYSRVLSLSCIYYLTVTVHRVQFDNLNDVGGLTRTKLVKINSSHNIYSIIISIAIKCLPNSKLVFPDFKSLYIAACHEVLLHDVKPRLRDHPPGGPAVCIVATAAV